MPKNQATSKQVNRLRRRTQAILCVVILVLMPAMFRPTMQLQGAAEQTIAFLSFDMKTAQDGWALAEVFIEKGNIGSDYLLITHDGARTWEILNPPGYEFNPAGGFGQDFFALDKDAAWVFQSDSLWRTTDGGKTWHASKTGFFPKPDVMGLSAYFYDTSLGWAFTENYHGMGNRDTAIERTTDGGATWQSADNIIDRDAFDYSYSGAAFASPTDGWFAAQPGLAGKWELGHTTNGTDWHIVHLPDDGPKCGFQIGSLRAYKPGALQALVRCSNDPPTVYIYYTEDTGKTWRITSTPATMKKPAVMMVTASVGWAVDVDGKNVVLYRTEDGGQTWKSPGELPFATHEMVANGLSFDFLDERYGWAADNATDLWSTTDGGKTWVQFNLRIEIH